MSRVLLSLVCGAVSSAVLAQPQPLATSLGHEVGADYRLVKWPAIVEYFQHLEAASDKLLLEDIGPTTEGNRMILATISSPETIANLGPHRDGQRKISDPRLIADAAERERLAAETKVPILVNCQLHSTEVAASQMSMELAYNLVTDESPRTKEILERCIILLVPCANPDGQIMVAEWYERSIGTPWEGRASMPKLYQKYAGHDNNRDWFMLNLQETRNTTKVLYEQWFPTIVWDVHQMGNEGARLFVPPFFDPKNQNVHPGIDQTLLIIGGHMAGDLAANGRKGVVHSAIYDNWWAGGFRTTPYRHNMVGILTEAASANLASPIFQRKGELDGHTRGLPDYVAQTNFPDPWPGGWWRLRDIVEYELDIATSLFTLAARYHDRFQGNYIQFGEEAIAAGVEGPPYAWLVPPDQRDPRSAYEMLERLSATAIEVHRADEAFTADGVEYPAGTFILYTAQPFRPHLMDMMERQAYPDREMYPGGPAEQPYDMAGWTLPLQMGVWYVEVAHAFEAKATKLDAIPFPQGQIAENGSNFLVHARSNDDYRLMSRLYAAGIPFWFAGETDSDDHQEGDFVVFSKDATRARVTELIQGLAVSVESISDADAKRIGSDEAKRPRTALYQPYIASMEEGWTRLALDTHEMAYESIFNAGIRAGKLRERYDCIVLPSVGPQLILDGYPEDATAPEYVGGIGREGVVALQEFVAAGGTLVCMDESSNLVIDEFNVPVRNVVRDKKSFEFYCPGSVLRLWMDTAHPVGYGMPEWYSGYFAGSQVFELAAPEGEPEASKDTLDPDRSAAKRFPVKVISRYSDTVLLESGWMRGEDLVRDKPAIVEVGYGEGRIYLFGISVQRRGQPHGTFRILFNAIQSSTM